MTAEARQANVSKGPSAHGRMACFDVVRGFSVVSMVLFHLCYDLRFIYGVDLAFFRPPLQDVWRASISWTFLFVAGCMCSFSRNALRRAACYLGCAAAVFLATTLVAVDTPISFGIIFCMGASTLLEHLLDACGITVRGIPAALACFVLFLVLRGVPMGHIGLLGHELAVPRALYATPYLSWLGFPGPGFASGDYYPVIPFTLMYLCGAAMGRHFAEVGYPSWVYSVRCKPLELVGRHSLVIYVLHQPLLLLACQVLLP